MGLKLERARAGGGQSRELPALNQAAGLSELATNSPGDRDPEGIPRLKQHPDSPETHWTPLQAPKSQGYPRDC